MSAMTLGTVIIMFRHRTFLTSGLDLTGQNDSSIERGCRSSWTKQQTLYYILVRLYDYRLSMLMPYPSKYPTLEQGLRYEKG